MNEGETPFFAAGVSCVVHPVSLKTRHSSYFHLKTHCFDALLWNSFSVIPISQQSTSIIAISRLTTEAERLCGGLEVVLISHRTTLMKR